MTSKFLLFTEPRWVGFKLMHEGKKEERKFPTIADAFDYVRALPESQGAPFVVFDEHGKEMAALTV